MTYSTTINTQFSSGTNLTLYPKAKELFVRIRDGVVNEIIKHGLTKTQSKVFFYFTQLDRFGDRSAKFDLASALEVMGIGKTAYYAAIAFFKNKGWIEFPERETYVSNNTVPGKNFANTNSQPSANTDSDFTNTNSQSEKTKPDFANTNRGFAKTNSQSEKTKSKRLKPAPSKRSATPQTLQTNSDLNQTNKTLSEAKRERNEFLWKNAFDETDRRQLKYFAYQVAIPKLPIKPALPDAWIICNCQELFNQMMYDTKFQKKWEQFFCNSPAVEIQQDTSEAEPHDTSEW